MIMTTKTAIQRPFKAALLLGTILLGACEMHAPSNLNETKIQVSEENVSHTMAVSETSDEALSSIVQGYTDRGGMPMNLTVTYDPESYRNTAMLAGNNASKFAKSLRKMGVENISSAILPIKDQGDESRVMISYRAVAAFAPEGCGDMPGMRGNLVEPDPSYRLGCGVDTMIAKQVARPSDLLGRESDDPNTDGRSASNIIEVYRSGAQNKPLQGESASGTD